MITLFSEEVETTSTNSDHNTLYVESFEEAFFGVYEFEINGNTIIAEQIHNVGGSPVVRIPVVDVDGNKAEYDFVLKEGIQKVELGTCGSVIVQHPDVIEEKAIEEEQFVESLNEDDLASNVETEYIPVTKYNTLWVEGFDEVYFDVYEFDLNGTKVLAEKIDTLGEHPVVRVPFTEVHGNKIKADFVLKIGTQSNPEIISEEAIEDEPDVIEEKAIEEEQFVESLNEDDLASNFVLKIGTQSNPEIISEEAIEDEPVMIEGRNTLFVESFEETFFGVYEFEINGNRVIAEEVDVVGNYPVVKIPVVRSTGDQVEVEFILRQGNEDSILENSKAVLTEESMSVIKEEDLKAKLHEETKTLIEQSGATDINISYRIDKEEIISEEAIEDEPVMIEGRNTLFVESFEETFFGVYEFEINGNRVIAEEVDVVGNYPVVKIPVVRSTGDQVEVEFILRQGNEDSILENSKAVLTEESMSVIKEEDLKAKLHEETKTLIEQSGATDINISYRIDKEEIIEEIKTDSKAALEKLRESQQELKERKKEHQKIASTINVLEKTQIELRDEVNVNKREILEATEKSEKSVNKALSRLGTVKKELTNSKAEFDTIKDALAHSIMLAEERVKGYYHDKIEEIENTIFNNIRRDEILNVVKESKAKILTELSDTSDIKEQLRIIATEEYDPISGEEFQRKLKKGIDDKFASEMVNIRRMVELYSGGGTNAVQFADGGTMNGDLNVNGNILSGGENLTEIFGNGTGPIIAGSGTASTVTLWDSISSITDSKLTQTSTGMTLSGSFVTEYIALSTNTTTLNLSANDEQGLVVNGNSTIYGNLSVLGDFTYIDTIVSIASALSVVNHGTGPAFYAEQTGANQPIAKFVDTEGGEIVFDDGGSIGIGTITPNEKLTVVGNISATGDVNSVNITTLTNNVSALYAYLIQNFDHNQNTTATDINDFVTNYPKTGLQPGDVVTLSAVNTAYILGNNDGSALTDWFEVNLKPNFLFYKQGLSDYGVLDTFPLSGAKSTKYIVEVEDKSDNALFYGEVNVVSNGTIAVATEYGLNHTTVFPFVEFGADVVSGTHIQLSAVGLESKNMANFVFKGNRSNLFG